MYRIFAILLALGFAFPVLAADTADVGGVAKKIREGKINVGKTYTTDPIEDGRFHNIHGTAIDLGCKACHTGKKYQADFLFVRKGEILPKKAKGQADRAVCLGCHQTGGPAETWYTERSGK